MIYAGPNTNSRKVTEYGGNTLGYGSRSVLGTGWPKDLVKVRDKLWRNAFNQTRQDRYTIHCIKSLVVLQLVIILSTKNYDENNDFENSAGCEYEEEGYDGGWEEEEIEEKVV